MKRLFTFLLAVLLPVITKAYYQVTIDGSNYNLYTENMTAVMTKCNKTSGDVVIPDKVSYFDTDFTVTGIGGGIFFGCNKLTSIVLPNSLTSIGGNAFWDCTDLQDISVPDNVSDIGGNAFYNTGWYNSQPDGIVYAGNVAYKYKGDMPDNSDIILRNGTIGIAGYAFDHCQNLISISIPESVKVIGELAFQNCSNLSSIVIPRDLTQIGLNAFNICNNLKNVTFHCKKIEPWFKMFYPLENVIIGDDVETIADEAFSGCTGVKSVIMGKKVTDIGESAFSGCSSLTYISIPDGITEIKRQTFSGCGKMTSIIIPSSLTSIGYNAFNGVKLKKTIWLTNTPPTGYAEAEGAMNYVANEQFTSLKTKTVYPFLSSIFDVNGIVYVPVSPSERTCDAIDCIYDSSAQQTIIESTVQYKGIDMKVRDVKPYICANNHFIQYIEWNYNGAIPDYAFDSCTSLVSVVFGDETTSFGAYSFSKCSSLKELILPPSITLLCNHSLSECTQLSSLLIPNSVSAIHDFAFSGCTELKTFIIEDRNTTLSLGSNDYSPLFASCPLDSIYIGGNISYPTTNNKGYSPFYRNTSLRSVVITDKETEISPNEFYGCTNLKNVKIGNGVTTISDWAFSGCSSLKNFEFGSNVENIGREAFSDCASVTSIISRTGTPPTCGSQALDDINKWTCNLIVPKGCKENYQIADQWKDFFFMEEGDFESSDNPGVKKCATPTISYKDGKLLFNCTTEGADCFSEITDSDISHYQGNEINLTATYHISVYAAMSGYENSEIATATLCWIDMEPKMEGITGAVSEVRALPVLIQSNNGTLMVSGVSDGTIIGIYNTAGVNIVNQKATGTYVTIPTTLRKGEIAIVKIDDKAIKVLIQ